MAEYKDSLNFNGYSSDSSDSSDSSAPSNINKWTETKKNLPEIPEITHLENKSINKVIKVRTYDIDFVDRVYNDNFTIIFYLAYADLQEKSIRQIDFTLHKMKKFESKKRQFKVYISENDRYVSSVSNEFLNVTYDIITIANYLKDIDSTCSYCPSFNRTWNCCGLFAPYMYIYFYLLSENKLEQFSFNLYLNGTKQKNLYKLATVFYKIITGYGDRDERYKLIINNLYKKYGIYIPSHNKDPEFWYLPSQTYDENTFKNNTSYMLNLCHGTSTAHHFFIYRYNDNIIISDSWASKNTYRGPITRIFSLKKFLECINFITYIYHNIRNILEKDRKNATKKYNIYMDLLFLIPYSDKQIEGNKFTFSTYNLYKIRIVDPYTINSIFYKIAEHQNVILNKYYHLGGIINSHNKTRKMKSNKKIQTNKKITSKKR